MIIFLSKNCTLLRGGLIFLDGGSNKYSIEYMDLWLVLVSLKWKLNESDTCIYAHPPPIPESMYGSYAFKVFHFPVQHITPNSS